MARLEAVGISDFADILKEIGESDNDELIEDMLTAGADIAVDEWKKGIASAVRTDRSTGETAAHVKAAKTKRSAGTSEKKIYPQGKDKRGVRYAEKAYILNYGKSGQAATHSLENAEKTAEPLITDAMQNVLNEYLEKEGL